MCILSEDLPPQQDFQTSVAFTAGPQTPWWQTGPSKTHLVGTPGNGQTIYSVSLAQDDPTGMVEQEPDGAGGDGTGGDGTGEGGGLGNGAGDGGDPQRSTQVLTHAWKATASVGQMPMQASSDPPGQSEGIGVGAGGIGEGVGGGGDGFAPERI